MKIGIDLGTTNSAVAYIDESGLPQIVPNKEGERTTPSVLLYEDKTFIVGTVAKESSVDDPENTVQFVKRQIGNNAYKFLTDDDLEFTAEELSAVLLKRLKTDAENFTGESCTEAVITVPAYFDDAQRQATKDAGEIAGLNVLKIINEPTAAALAFTHDNENYDEPKHILVYDLGGGTFDVTLMTYSTDEVTVRATSGDRNLGGFDFDNAIINKITETFEAEHGIDIEDDAEAFQELREKAEAAKKTLSSRQRATISIHADGQKLKTVITQDEFKVMTQHLIDRTALIMEDALDEADLDWFDLDRILLVGGSTRMPAVPEMIESFTGIVPSNEVHPDEVVSVGAAFQASMLEGDPNVKQKNVIDVNSHGLGVVALNDKQELQNFVVIKKNTQIPTEEEYGLQTVVDNQEFLKLRITEGDDDDLDYVNIIGEVMLTLTPRPAASPVSVIISYDDNAIVHAQAIDGVDNRFLDDVVIERKSNLTQVEVNEMQSKLDRIDID